MSISRGEKIRILAILLVSAGLYFTELRSFGLGLLAGGLLSAVPLKFMIRKLSNKTDG